MKKLDNLEKFLVVLHCEDCSIANFSRAVTRNEWEKVTERHFTLRDSIIRKMKSLNEEIRQEEY